MKITRKGPRGLAAEMGILAYWREGRCVSQKLASRTRRAGLSAFSKELHRERITVMQTLQFRKSGSANYPTRLAQVHRFA